MYTLTLIITSYSFVCSFLLRFISLLHIHFLSSVMMQFLNSWQKNRKNFSTPLLKKDRPVENIAAECLIKRGYSLYYYKKDDNGEIEFLIEKNGEVIPLEVKASNSSTASLNRFIKKYQPSVAYKLVSTKGG